MRVLLIVLGRGGPPLVPFYPTQWEVEAVAMASSML